ncbi:uncharacterized protein LOC128883877 isoform X1 [Hylaeus volcanicus]|uniref:uncharacterized protein LOC128883877 isoform X1 n=1 Tax=Hylaeus volcanicus TaxID=313075 RepID=UPI0023B77C89|nr:uncharacterized protein LOC128883877 isoform X1 [Hylaeus volcanicus]
MTKIHFFFVIFFSVFSLCTIHISAVSLNLLRWPWTKHKLQLEDDALSTENFGERIPDDDDNVADDDDDLDFPINQHQSSRTPLNIRENTYNLQNYPEHSNTIAPHPFLDYLPHESTSDFNPEEVKRENGLLRRMISSNVPQSIPPSPPQPIYIPYAIPSPSAPPCGSCGSPVTVVSLSSNGDTKLASSKCKCCCDTNETKPKYTSSDDKTAEDIETIQNNEGEEDKQDQEHVSKDTSKKEKTENDEEEDLNENEDMSDLSVDDEDVDTSD